MEKYWDICDPDFIHGAGAESFNQFRERVEKCIERLAALNLDSVIIFTHEQVILLLKLLFDGRLFTMADYRKQVMNYPIDNIEIFETKISLSK